jgi:hypothetical protein
VIVRTLVAEGSFFPEIKGFLELFFVGLLALLTLIVGVFSLYLLRNQFRNPGRRPGTGP